MWSFSFFKKKETAGKDFVQSSLEHDQQNDKIEDVNDELDKVVPSIAKNDNESKEVVNDSEKQAEKQAENQSENQVETPETPEKIEEKIGKGPDKMAIAGIIGGATYKTLTSVLGVKTITDLGLYGLGWLGQKIGWKTAEKISQKSDMYQWSTQSGHSEKDRQKLDVALKIKDIIDSFYFYKDQRDAFLRHGGFDVEEYKQKMEGLVKEYKEKTLSKALDELSEDEKSAVEEIKSEISLLRQTKDDVLKNFPKDKNNAVSSSACEYNKSLKNARSSEYYALSKEQKAEVDKKIDEMFGEKKKLLEERAKLRDADVEQKNKIDSRIQEIEQNKYLPDQTMNKRLGQIIAKHNKDSECLNIKDVREIDLILKDYIHSKVAFSSLVKDGLNTAFVLVGGPAAGAFRGLVYGGLALAERYQKNEQEYRKKYSWNEVGEKIGFGTKMHDLFIGSIKETWAGINGKKYQETYQLDEKGKLNRQEENQNIENNLQRYGAKAKAIGEVFRLFGIGTQAITAGITDGVNFKHAAEGFAKTFTEGNVVVNVGKNWYDNFRIDQRIAKACGRLFGGEASTTINANNVDDASNEIVSSGNVSNNEREAEQIIDNLTDSKSIVPKGGSVSEVLGKNVDLKKGIVLFISKGPGEKPEIIEDYNPSNIQPGVRLWEKNGQIYALDENPNNLSYYQAHNGVEILEPIESQGHKNIIAETIKPKATVVPETSEISQVSEDLQTQEASQIPEAPAAVKPEIVLDEPVVSQPSEETEADIVKAFEATQTTSPEATVVSQAPQDLEFQGASVVLETSPTIEPEVAVSESGIDESVLVEPSQQEQASIAKVFEEGQAIQKPKSLNDWKIEDYKDALYGPLAAKDTTYQQVAEAAGKKDSEFFEKFILSNRPGGIISNRNEGTDYQDFDSDIDRIYHSNNLDNNQKIEILENIKNGLNDQELTSRIQDLSLRDSAERQYGILKDSIENDIAILKGEYAPKVGVSKDVSSLSNNINEANRAFADADINDEAAKVMLNPNSTFSDVKENILKAFSGGKKTDVGGITFRRIGDDIFYENGSPVTEDNYKQALLEHAGVLNRLTASDEFNKMVENSESIKLAISEDLKEVSFVAVNGSPDSYEKFIDSGSKFDEKIASLKNVLGDKQSMKVKDLTFARLNDKIYLVTDTKKVVELKDKAVINDILTARRVAMQAHLSKISIANK